LTFGGQIVEAGTVTCSISKSKSVERSLTCCVKLYCSLVNVDLQAFPNKGSSLVEETSCRFCPYRMLAQKKL